ncbi:hypothetical protein [Amphritea sp.]|uniref:hypothetical protein n=1 Tax=Amphritea sp. TaxID=1872502 RepID=UPI003563063B
MTKTYLLVGLFGCLLSAGFLFSAVSDAGEADVLNVTITPSGNHRYDFSVTVRHDDTGWDHYANKWEVVDPAGAVLATRTLHHPHTGEQPFTRSLRSVAIPADITTVKVRAHDLVHQYGGTEFRVDLPQ